MSKGISFYTIDVFTDQVFSGNQLAVFIEDRSIDDQFKQGLAKELNYSETTFIKPISGDKYYCQIFTPEHEIPFAGHPTLGSAAIIYFNYEEKGEIKLVEKIGEIECSVTQKENFSFSVQTDLDLDLPIRKIKVAPDTINKIIGMDIFNTTNHFSVINSGGDYLMIQIPEDFSINEINISLKDLANISKENSGLDLYLFKKVDKNQYSVRMFAPNAGILEDPATGSAAVALAKLLYKEHNISEEELIIHQGRALSRPSKIYVTHLSNGKIRLKGNARLVLNGKTLI
ncbi:PhzF family phenazine biosynthesis protein [Gracilimonas sp.]|uniref:PhzF family phenazine biosynthesis protein n=1 Tax=Gracilimonas sp. TaxID=1974203 RepID=UPI0032EED6FC